MSEKVHFKSSLYSKTDLERLVSRPKEENKDSHYRSEWRKDYGRLIHSAAFRRLQGKTQLFPNHESDFFRNRLTHSLEVAQIAKSITLKINDEFLHSDNPIEVDIVEIVGLAHDIGHPPFGHNGEEALDECMRKKSMGGFEGNAQTFRILARLEKKTAFDYSGTEPVLVKNGKDNRAGLNLTARVLASVLKYDEKIPATALKRPSKYRKKAMKGYYQCDQETVEKIKALVLQGKKLPKHIKFKTIECQIMDIADDIAYSTYDIEDAFKAGLLDPLGMLSAKDKTISAVATEVAKLLLDLKTNDPLYSHLTDDDIIFTPSDVYDIVIDTFDKVFSVDKAIKYAPFIAGDIAMSSKNLANNGYHRTDITSYLVGTSIEGIKFEPNHDFPALSRVYLDIDTFKRIETFKKFAFKVIIDSPLLKLTEYKGKEIVKKLFEALSDHEHKGYTLLPADYQDFYLKFDDEASRKRVVCDFIAGMTDKYAMDFYNRLFGSSPETMHKPI